MWKETVELCLILELCYNFPAIAVPDPFNRIYWLQVLIQVP